MKRDPIDMLIQLAFLEGEVTTHGLYERTVMTKKASASVSAEARQKLLARLEGSLQDRKKVREIPLTVGSFLKKVRIERSLKAQEISLRVGLTPNIYRMLEEDRISPLKVSVGSWKKVRLLFELSMDSLEEMIRRTHRLVFFQPSFRTTLARYKERTGKGKKSQALKGAARELYTRAKLYLPEKEERKLSDLIKAISK